MAYWLVKSEPSTYSWEQIVKDGRTFWSGVRNHQAANNMKAMKKGDRAFFYHSGDDKAVVGTVEIVKEYYPDNTDATGKFGMVDVKAGTVTERVLNAMVSVRAAHAVSPVHEGLRPGTYAPMES